MTFLNRFNISFRLSLGFGIIILLLLFLGIVGYRGIISIWNDSERMYHHPYTVSNEVREIQIRIYAIHRSMKDVSLANDLIEMKKAVDMVNQYEQEAFESFDLVQERFLGDPKQIIECRENFTNWRSIRQQVIVRVIAGDHEAAVAVTKGEGAIYVAELIQSIQSLKDFANDKAREFHDHARESKNSTIGWTIVLLIVALFIGFLISYIITLSITKPVGKIVEHVKLMSTGDVRTSEVIIGNDEIAALAECLNSMQDNLLEKLEIAERVTSGDYSVKIKEQSEQDELAFALNTMTETLGNLNETNERENWIRNGIHQLNDVMRGDKELTVLCRDVISTLARYLGAQVGVIYKKNPELDELNLVASYAVTFQKGIIDRFAIGEGLVGQVGLEKEIISIKELPDGYLRVVSGLGDTSPNNVVIVPLVLNNELIGVIEVGSFSELDAGVMRLIEDSAESIAIAIQSAESRNVLKHLLQDTQQKTVQLEVQQEELRANNKELGSQAKRLRESEAQLQLQQEELATTNKELEEKNEYLEQQKREINQKNNYLENTRKELEEKAAQLEITSRYKSEFLANMSHELRTPLNSLLILSRDLMDNSEGNLNEDQVESSSIIYKAGNDLLQLINDILDLSKIEAGKLNMNFERLDLDSFFNGLVKRFSPLAKEKGINLAVQRGNDLPDAILTDAQRFNQILTNLLSNAVKFTHKGKVEVMIDPIVGQETPKLMLRVMDTGIGIPDEKKAEVFEAFQQVDGSISRNYGGSGLGLSITRELCKLLGIEISFDSVVGEGTVFNLVIPIEYNGEQAYDGEVSPGSVLATPPHKAKALPLKVSPNAVFKATAQSIDDDVATLSSGDRFLLVVEDDPDFARMLRKVANKRGFKFLHAPTGEIGIKLAQEHQPNAIILDIYLPGIQGWEVLDLLKGSKKTRHIPVHMMSADSHPIEALRKGAIGFLQKPVNSEQLADSFSKIESFIDKDIKDLLIVDGDKNVQNSLLNLIECDKTSISVASKASEALDLLKKKSFDCIILDIALPDMSGLDLLKSIKDTFDSEMPPVIIHTGQEISKEMEFELQSYSKTIIIKGVRSYERLVDETALFLHQVIEELPEYKQEIITQLHDSDTVLEGKKVLLVDDDMRNVFTLSKLLSAKKMEVIKAANGQKALEALEEHPDIDVVLMDVMMPVMDGLEATRRIRKNPDFFKLPVICVTAKAMKEDRQKCFDAGANDYLTKPVDTERLFSVMRVWL